MTFGRHVGRSADTAASIRTEFDDPTARIRLQLVLSNGRCDARSSPAADEREVP
jgi:hypothetical protein